MKLVVRLAIALTIGLLLGAFGIARADTPARTTAAAAYREGQRHYAAGEYPAAAASFLDAYDADPDPVYLFNAAQAFRFANDCAQAATYYRRFLAAVVSAPNLDRVRANRDEMEACAKRLASQPPPTPAPTPPAAPPVTPPSPPAPAPAPLPPTTTDHDGGTTQRRIGLALGATGLAIAAAGVWFHHDVGYFEQRVAGCVPEHPCTADQVDRWNSRGHRASLVAISSYSVAGAALIGGATLYVLGRSATTERSIALAPTAGGALVTARGTF